MGHIQLRKKLEMLPINSSSPPDSRIHPVFHIYVPSKKRLGEIIVASTNLPPMADDGDLLMESEVILDTRWVK